MDQVSTKTDSAPAETCRSSFLQSGLQSVARGLALFFGGFTLLNVCGELLQPGFDATIWWIDFRPVPALVSLSALTILSLMLLKFCVRPDRCSLKFRQALAVLVAVVLAASVINAATFYSLILRGQIDSSFPASLSLFVTLAMLIMIAGLIVTDPAHRSKPAVRTLIPATAVACMIGFPLLQMYCFGWTDYSRKADVAVVFGCKVGRDGRLSAQLQDRVRSACELYDEGLVECLIMSGGPGPGAVHETHAMRAFAIDYGIPAERILVDEKGWSTDETVASTIPLFRQHEFHRVLAVSHFYHLPRIKLSYQRMGQEVFTVPARQKFGILHKPFQLSREVVALWAYYLRPVTGL